MVIMLVVMMMMMIMMMMIMMMMMIDDDDTEVQEVQVCIIRGGMIRVQIYKKYCLQITTGH